MSKTILHCVVTYMANLRLVLVYIIFLLCSYELPLAHKNHTIVKRQQPTGGLCVRNADCATLCCVYRNSIHGTCFQKAGLGQICGFIRTPRLRDGAQIFRICPVNQCETQCCCRDKCCPTNYCIKILSLHTEVCTKCVSACCCNDKCCPIQYCHDALIALLTMKSIEKDFDKPIPCTRCQSGCCCGTSCCLSFKCQGQNIGFRCRECPTGCCCGPICCAATYCERRAFQPTRMLGMYHGVDQRYLPFLVSAFGKNLFEAMTPLYQYSPYGASYESDAPPNSLYRTSAISTNKQNQKFGQIQLPPSSRSFSHQGLNMTGRAPTGNSADFAKLIQEASIQTQHVPMAKNFVNSQQTFGPVRNPMTGVVAGIPGSQSAALSTDNKYNYFGANIATSTKGTACLECTTGCCCSFGCCNGGYCLNSDPN